MFLPHPRVKVSIVGSLCDPEEACLASDRQGSNFESCVWRTVSSQSSHHPQEVLLAQFSLYVHKGGLKPDSFHFYFYDVSSKTNPTKYLVHPILFRHTSSHVRTNPRCGDCSNSKISIFNPLTAGVAYILVFIFY